MLAPMIRRSPRPSSAGVLILILLGIVAWRVWETHHAEPPPPDALPAGDYQVLRVVDGDTLLLANRARIRLIGANAPESVKPEHPIEPWGLEASEFTKKLVQGRTVRLQFDKERQDQFGRLLAYVWVKDPESGQEKLLNEELLRAGLARATLWYNFSDAMKRRFRKAEEEARRAHRGIWSEEKTVPAAA
jgi:micrococcal nuclease